MQERSFSFSQPLAEEFISSNEFGKLNKYTGVFNRQPFAKKTDMAAVLAKQLAKKKRLGLQLEEMM